MGLITKILIILAISTIIFYSCQVEPYSRFNAGNVYPNNTSIILPFNTNPTINWDSLLNQLSKCNKPIIVLDEKHVLSNNPTLLNQYIQTARNLKFHIAIKVSTKYGERPLEEIARQLIHIQDLLPEINGLLIDEILDNPDMLDYYSQLSGIARELGYDFIIMNVSNSLNPDMFTEIADALIVYENLGISEDIVPDKEIRNKSISIIYASSWDEITPFIKYLRKGLIGKWIFITDKYELDSTGRFLLPSFWNELIQQLCTKA